MGKESTVFVNQMLNIFPVVDLFLPGSVSNSLKILDPDLYQMIQIRNTAVNSDNLYKILSNSVTTSLIFLQRLTRKC